MRKLLVLLTLTVSITIAAANYDRKSGSIEAFEVTRANLASIESELGSDYIGLMDNTIDSDLRVVYHNGTGDRTTLKLTDYMVKQGSGEFYGVSKAAFENDFVIP